MDLKKKCYIPLEKMCQWYEEIKNFAASGTTENISKLLENVPATGTDEKGNTLLHYVSEIDSDDIVKHLIKADFNINAKNRQDETALIIAILKNNEKTVKTLISLGANIHHIYYKDGRGPLYFAVSEGYTNLIKLLLDAGCDVNAKDRSGITPITTAIENNNIEMIKILLYAGASRDHTYYYRKEGPLHLACQKINLNIIELLLNSGYAISDVDNQGYTPLHLVMLGDEVPHNKNDVMGIMNILIKAGADVNVKDFRGETPLHVAAKAGPEEVDLLLKAGADPNEVDNYGNTPLHILIGSKNQHALSVTRLIEAGANIHNVNTQGQTCIHLAAGYASVELLTLFIKLGANLGLVDRDNKDPLDYAVCQWGRVIYIERFVHNLHDQNQILDNDAVVEDLFGIEIIEKQLRCIEILCKYTTKINHVIKNDNLECCNHTKIIRALLRQGMIIDFERNGTRKIWEPLNSFSKLQHTLIRHAAVSNGYKDGKGIINFNLEKFNTEQKKYYADCLDELKRLNVFWVYETMPLFNLIEGRVSSRYVLNDDLIQAFKTGTIAKSFPIYNDELTERFEKEHEKYKLILNATAGLQSLIKFDENAFAFIYSNILKYLETDDQLTLASLINVNTSESFDKP